MAVLFTDLVERPNTAASEDGTIEDMYLEMTLEQNGLSDLVEDISEHFLAFTDKLDARIKSYLEKLTAEELLSECQMIEWFQIFSAETNSKKKMKIFSMFFNLYYSNS
ncbi:uncharacterized protein LOC128863209 [Anastrepha ludens]|uniref:uncharacterized protein LOC128863209 n=1 Tax=Anastrepha ludens TaxID=28586 RepID=UPI0023B1B7D3|nr:uncharacterized protein LOC128863209 [Anastrepha ludens]